MINNHYPIQTFSAIRGRFHANLALHTSHKTAEDPAVVGSEYVTHLRVWFMRKQSALDFWCKCNSTKLDFRFETGKPTKDIWAAHRKWGSTTWEPESSLTGGLCKISLENFGQTNHRPIDVFPLKELCLCKWSVVDGSAAGDLAEGQDSGRRVKIFTCGLTVQD